MYRIVETDNYGGDYPDEKFVDLPLIYNREGADAIVEAINRECCDCGSSRYWIVVDKDHVLQPGFEP